MQCEHAQEFLSEYVTGELDRALVVSLENHLVACGTCSEAVSGLRTVWTALDQMPTVEPPSTFHSQLMQRIAEEKAAERVPARAAVQPGAWRRFVQPKYMAYAAAMLILLVGAEYVQVQRASLGPIGLLMNAVHPTALLRSTSASWIPKEQGGGTLVVRVEANSQVNGAPSRDHVVIQVLPKSVPGNEGAQPVQRDGEVTSSQPAELSIPMDHTPSDATDTLRITLTPLDASGRDSTTVDAPIPAMP